MADDEPKTPTKEAPAEAAAEAEAPATPPAAEQAAPAEPAAPEAPAAAAEGDVPAPAPEAPPKAEAPAEDVPVPEPSEEPTIELPKQPTRQPPGGRSAINLGIDIHAPPIIRPPSGRAPPGGRATVQLGNEGPRTTTPKDAQFAGTFRNLEGAKVEAIREVDRTPAKSVAHSVFNADAISGAEVKQVPRIQPPTPSKIVFTEDGALVPDAPPERTVPMSAQKRRELSGNTTNIFSGVELEHPTLEDPASSPDAASPEMVPADKKHITAMLISELRTALRARGLNPAGSHQALVERLLEGIAGGAPPLLVPRRNPASGMTSAAISNNYARSEGQNLGNFLTDRPSSRVSKPPGGASQIVFGDEAPAQAPTFLRTVNHSENKKQLLASTVFSESAEVASPTRPVMAAKTAELVGQDIFKQQQALAPAPHVSDAKKGEISGHMEGSGLASGAAAEPYLPTVSLSDGKKLELSGHNSVFEPKGVDHKAAFQLSEAKRRELTGEANEGFYQGGKDGKVPEAVKLSEGKQRELQGTRAEDGAEKQWRPMSARIESGRQRQFGSIDNFKPGPVEKKELTAAGQVKAQHLGGSVVLKDEVGPVVRNATRVTHAPGGTSQIVFG